MKMTGKRSRENEQEIYDMEQELLQHRKEVMNIIFNDYELDKLYLAVNLLDRVDNLLNDINDYVTD